jgi:hypothetical protein
MGVNATVEVAASSTTTVAALTTATGIYLQFNKGEYKALATCSSIITGKSAVVTVNSLSVALYSYF